MSDELLTLAEVAQRLRVSDDTVYRLASSGKLPGTKVGRAWRFSADAIEQLVAGESAEPACASTLEEHLDFRDLYENSPDMCLSVEAATGRIRHCNATLTRTTGYAREELLGRPIRDLYDPVCRDYAEAVLRHVRECGEARDIELTLLTKTGVRIEIGLNVSTVRDASGKVLFTRSVLRDLTATKARERAARLLPTGWLESVVGEFTDVVFVIDNQDQVVYVNDVGRQFLRLAPSETITRSAILSRWQVFEPDGVTLLPDEKRACTRSLRGEAVAPYDAVVVDEQGNRFEVNVRATPLKDEQGQTSGCVVILHDTMPDKRRTEKLRLTEFTVRHSPDAVFWVRPDGGVDYVNDRACESLGYTREELLRLSVPDLDPDVPADRWPSMWANQIKNRRIAIESHHRTKQGRVFPVEIYATYINFDGVEYSVAHVRDVSSRRRADAQLKESEARFQRAIDGSRDGVWDWDIVSGSVWFSPQYVAQLGHDPSESFPAHVDWWIERLHPDEKARIFDAVDKHLAGVAPYDIEYRMRTKSGEWRWFRVKGQAVWNEDGVAVKMSGTASDITDRKQTDVELEQARKQAEAANRAKSEFLANMSHEIRTPLTSILGFAELVREQANDPQLIEWCQTIERNGAHLMDLINDVLDLSKVEAGRMEWESAPCSPTKLAEEVVQSLEPRARQKGLRLTTVVGPNVPALCSMDPRRVRQALLNVVGNAVKFTSHGHVHVHLLVEQDSGGSFLAFVVNDTGPGMNAEQLGRLFEPFSQVDSSANRPHGGTGLGLCISRRLMRAAGGDVTATSAPGVGSAFTIRLPIESPQEPPREEHRASVAIPSPQAVASPVAVAPSRPSRVLVADDSPDNRRLLDMVFRKEGVEATFVEDGAQLVERLSRPDAAQVFDVALVDLQMPVMDGESAIRELRRRRCRVPLIALTANAMNDSRRRCLDAGCDGFLTKPIDRAALVAEIKRWREKSLQATPIPPLAFVPR